MEVWEKCNRGLLPGVSNTPGLVRRAELLGINAFGQWTNFILPESYVNP